MLNLRADLRLANSLLVALPNFPSEEARTQKKSTVAVTLSLALKRYWTSSAAPVGVFHAVETSEHFARRRCAR